MTAAPFSLFILAIAATSSVIEAGGGCTGGNAVCNILSSDIDCHGANFKHWCTVNSNPNAFDPYCQGTIICAELAEEQCKIVEGYGWSENGCSWTVDKSRTFAVVNTTLASVAVALLLLTVCLLYSLRLRTGSLALTMDGIMAKIATGQMAKEAPAMGTEMTDPLLSPEAGADA